MAAAIAAVHIHCGNGGTGQPNFGAIIVVLIARSKPALCAMKGRPLLAAKMYSSGQGMPGHHSLIGPSARQ